MGGHNGIKQDLLNNSATANNLEGLYASNAAGINSTLVPTLKAQMINPQGYNPATMASMITAAEQTAGGSNADATGGALLRAARTRNAGAAPAAIAASNRAAGQNLSQRNAVIQNQNAELKAKQQLGAEAGLGSLYGENVNAGNQALGLSNSALGTAGNLKNFWQDLLMQGLKSGGEVAAAAAG